MSLETVLQIGKVLRNSKDNIKYFEHIESPKDYKGNYPICLTVPVNDDFSFDWNALKFTPENERDKLYYLKFKTSGSDSSKKYIFGDIYFSRKTTINRSGIIDIVDGGYYNLENPLHSKKYLQASSFFRGMNDFEEIIKQNETICLRKFRENLEKNIKTLENLLNYSSGVTYFLDSTKEINFTDFILDFELIQKYQIQNNFKALTSQNRKKLEIEEKPDFSNIETQKKLFNFSNVAVFIHFEFSNKNHWYSFQSDLNLVIKKILSDFVEETTNGIALKKTVYKTLCSGDKKNDIQFPSFQINNKINSFKFSNETLQDLFYAIDYSGKGSLISGTDIKLIVLPRGLNLTEKNYQEFHEKWDEARIIERNSNSASKAEPLFDFLLSENNTKMKDITSFDLIFCKKGGMSSPDNDLIEISGIEKSKLKMTKEKIRDIASEISQERKVYLKTEKDLSLLTINYSFQNILGIPLFNQKTNKVQFKPSPKYQSHILKVLPLIYSDNYFNDGELVSAFIQNVEYSIRNDDSKYNFLKFDLKFLFKIQNTNTDRFMEIINSTSYQIGLKMGKMAKPLKKAINSFEKSYVGLLSRRTKSREECIKFLNEIDEMLVRHGKSWAQISAEVRSKLAQLSLQDYDKDNLVFGFFEGYFTYEAKDQKKDFIKRIEKLVVDNKDNTELANEVVQLNQILKQIGETNN